MPEILRAACELACTQVSIPHHYQHSCLEEQPCIPLRLDDKSLDAFALSHPASHKRSLQGNVSVVQQAIGGSYQVCWTVYEYDKTVASGTKVYV